VGKLTNRFPLYAWKLAGAELVGARPQ